VKWYRETIAQLHAEHPADDYINAFEAVVLTELATLKVAPRQLYGRQDTKVGFPEVRKKSRMRRSRAAARTGGSGW
jgi:hypothetical protein